VVLSKEVTNALRLENQGAELRLFSEAKRFQQGLTFSAGPVLWKTIKVM
jgi:hypothetical protein